MIRKERQAFRSKTTGRVYIIDKALNDGLMILRTEDGLGTALAHKETVEVHFVKEEDGEETID